MFPMEILKQYTTEQINTIMNKKSHEAYLTII